MKTFKIYQLERQEYKFDCEYKGDIDEQGEPICTTYYNYTGETKRFLHTSKQELLNSQTKESKARITKEFNAVWGHVDGGTHKYDINRKPLTIIN